jgi:hypothetical protein
MDMVERVALALAKAERMDDNEDSLLKVYRPLAIAAIEAMREPTYEMKFGQDVVWPETAKAVWESMIDSILKSTRETQ